MKKAVNFIIAIASIICWQACNKSNKSNLQPLQWQWKATDTLVKMHPLFDSLYSATQTNDSALLYKRYNVCFDTLGLMLKDTALSITTAANYHNYLAEIFSTVNNTDSNYLKSKAKLLRFTIYYNAQANNSDKVIKYFDQFNQPELSRFSTDIQKLDRLIDLGAAYHKIGEHLKTEESYLAALALARKTNDLQATAMATVNLNIALVGKQQYDSVIRISAPLMNAPIEDYYKSKLALSMANAYLETNRQAIALSFIKKSESLLLKLDSTERPEDYDQRLGSVYGAFAKYYQHTNDIALADFYYEKVLSLFQKNKIESKRELAKFYIQLGNYKQQATTSKIEQTPLYYYNQAMVAVMPGFKTDDSLAVPNDNQLIAENVIFEALDAKAAYLTNTNEGGNKYANVLDRYYTTAFKVEKLLLNSFVYDDSKIDFVEESKKRTNLAVKQCYNMFNATKDALWLEKAFQFVENNRATVLLEKLKQNSMFQQQLANDSLTVLLKQLKIQRANSQANSETVSDELNQSIAQVSALLLMKYPSLSTQANVFEDISLLKVRKQLQQQTALISYYALSDTMYILYVDKNKVDFTAQKIDQTYIAEYKANCGNLSFQEQTPKVFFTQSFNIYHQLHLTTANSKIKELIILPDGVVNNLSFESLISDAYTNIGANKYLIQQYVFNYCYSFATINQSNEYSDISPKILVCTPAVQNKLRNQEALTYSANEAADIKKLYTNSLHLNDSEATSVNFLKNYSNYNIIHLATHAVSDSVQGNALIDFYDKPISAQQFQDNNVLDLDLVFLSACETSLGKQTSTEGVLSLARSLYYAGANNVIAAQWKINDAASAKVVNSFYNNIKTKKYAVSLQKAKLAYLKNSTAEKGLPFYWASFVHIGYQSAYHTKNYYWVALIGFIIFVSLTVFLLKTKHEKIGKLRNLGFFRKKK